MFQPISVKEKEKPAPLRNSKKLMSLDDDVVCGWLPQWTAKLQTERNLPDLAENVWKKTYQNVNRSYPVW